MNITRIPDVVPAVWPRPRKGAIVLRSVKDSAGLLLTFVATAICGGCDHPLDPPDGSNAVEIPDVSAYVTPRVRATLDAAGHFRFPPALEGPEVSVSMAEAVSLSEAWVRTYLSEGAGPIAAEVEAVHGRNIDWSEVKTTSPTGYPSRSSVIQPDGAAPAAFRRYIGAKYYIPFYAGSVPVATIGVSALANNLSIDSAGGLVRQPPEGGEITWIGIPDGFPTTIPPVPEYAVREIAVRTSSFVASVPELLLPSPGLSGLYSKWRLALDRFVRVRTASNGEVFETDVIYAGAWLRGPLHWFVAEAAQPEGMVLRYRRPDGATAEVYVRFDPDLPTQFREVTLEGSVQ